VNSSYFSSAQRAHNKWYIRWDNFLLIERGQMGIFARPRYINCSFLALESKSALKYSPPYHPLFDLQDAYFAVFDLNES
jgi:hypothetical protein